MEKAAGILQRQADNTFSMKTSLPDKSFFEEFFKKGQVFTCCSKYSHNFIMKHHLAVSMLDFACSQLSLMP